MPCARSRRSGSHHRRSRRTPQGARIRVAAPGCGDAGSRSARRIRRTTASYTASTSKSPAPGSSSSSGQGVRQPRHRPAHPLARKSPEDPVSEARLKLNRGPAPLDKPPTCAPATTTSDLTPVARRIRRMRRRSRASRSRAARRFTPASRRHRDPNAGAYSPFTLTFSRQDGEQDLSGLTSQCREVDPAGSRHRRVGTQSSGRGKRTPYLPAARRWVPRHAAAGAGATRSTSPARSI